jgi:hypothetical protein
MVDQRTGNYLGIDWLLRQPSGYFIVYGSVTTDGSKSDEYHFLAVNIPKRLVINNTTNGAFMKLCKEVFDMHLPYVHEILRCEKLVENEWKICF